MATLNLGSYDFKNGSVIGYSSTNDEFDVVDSVKGAAYTNESATISTITGGWSVDLSGLGDLESFSETSGKNWEITVSGANTERFEVGDGKDSITVSDLGKKGGEDAYVRTGAGKDVVDVQSATAGLVDLGDGADSIAVTAGTFSVTGGEGKDTVDVTGMTAGTVTLTDHNASEDVLAVGTVTPGTVTFGGDGVLTDGKKSVKVNETSGYYIVNTDKNGIVAWAATDGSNIDLSSYTKSVTIIGNNNDASADLLIGGSKADSIFAGAGDSVYGGAGSDVIVLDSVSSSNATTYVGLATAGGKDTVSGFEAANKAGVNDGDTVLLFENAINEGVELSLKGTDMTVTQGKGSLVLSGVKAGTETVINIQDNTGKNYAVDFVDGTASITAVDKSVYYANSDQKSNVLDYSSIDDSLVVDLGNTGIKQNTGDAIYIGKFTSVKGGQDDTILMGAADNAETLTAGTGTTTLWGGGKAADVLDGANNTQNVVTYFYTAGDGKDTVKNGNWGSSDENDVLYFSDASVSSIKLDGTTATFTMTDSADKLTVTGVNTNTAVKFTTDGETIQQAKLGKTGKSNTWDYEESVNMYLGGKSNVLVVSDDANVWLAGTEGTTYENVTRVDASSSTGTVVVAGDGAVDETIIGGKGSNSLWGGAGSSDDTLRASVNSVNTFYFGNGDGNDVITNTNSDDKVLLYNVALSDIEKIDDSTSGQLTITLKDSSSLTIKGMNSTNSVSQFVLSDESKWNYDYSSKSWSQK